MFFLNFNSAFAQMESEQKRFGFLKEGGKFSDHR